MAKIVVVTDIDKRSEIELLDRAQVMADGIDSNAGELPKIPTTAEILRNRVAFISSNRSRASTLRAEANELEQKVKDELLRLKTDIKANAGYVEQIVNTTQDTSLVRKLGLKLREKSSGASTGGTLVPQSVSLHEIPHTRQALELKFKPLKGAKSYGIIWAYGNTLPDSLPKQAMRIITSPRNIILNELESGKIVWVRIKSYHANNVESDWSDVVSRVVP